MLLLLLFFYIICMFTFTFEDEFCCDKVDIEKKYSNQK